MKHAIGGLLLLLAAAPGASPGAGKPSPAPSPVAAGKKAPVYTEEDLKKAKGHVIKLPDTAILPSPSPSDEKAGPSESEWKARHAARKAAISAAEEKIKALEAKIEALRLDLGATNVMDPNREQTRQAEIAQATTDLEAARKDLAAARQALSDFEDEARRANVPPGWLR